MRQSTRSTKQSFVVEGTLPSSTLTVLIIASFTALHPSTKLLSELVLSLRLLNLPAQTPVILSHQGSVQSKAEYIKSRDVLYRSDMLRHVAVKEHNKCLCKCSKCRNILYPQAHYDHLARVVRASRQGAVPPMYQEYLRRVQTLIPQYRQCTGLNFTTLVRTTGDGGYSGNMIFAMRHVATPYVLKVEQDRKCRQPCIPIHGPMISSQRMHGRSRLSSTARTVAPAHMTPHVVHMSDMYLIPQA